MICKYCGIEEEYQGEFTNLHICQKCIEGFQQSGICRLCGEPFAPKFENSTKCDKCREKNKLERKKEIGLILNFAKNIIYRDDFREISENYCGKEKRAVFDGKGKYIKHIEIENEIKSITYLSRRT